MRRIIYIFSALMVLLPSLALAQINTFQAQQGYVNSIQAQLNNLQAQITAALLPPTATAGQFVVENAAGTAYVAVSLSGDVSASLSSPGQITVNGSSASTFAVTNAETVGTTLGVTGNTTLSGTLAVTGASTLTGNTTESGNLAVTGTTTMTGLAKATAGLVNGCTWACTMSAGVCSTAVPCLSNFSNVAITGVSGGVGATTLATPANTPAVIACAQPSPKATSVNCLASTANATPVVQGIGY